MCVIGQESWLEAFAAAPETPSQYFKIEHVPCRPAPTCGAPSLQFVLLGVCFGEGLTGVDSLNASFQSRSTRGLFILMLPSGVLAACASFVEDMLCKSCSHKSLNSQLSMAPLFLRAIISRANCGLSHLVASSPRDASARMIQVTLYTATGCTNLAVR